MYGLIIPVYATWYDIHTSSEFFLLRRFLLIIGFRPHSTNWTRPCPVSSTSLANDHGLSYVKFDGGACVPLLLYSSRSSLYAPPGISEVRHSLLFSPLHQYGSATKTNVWRCNRIPDSRVGVGRVVQKSLRHAAFEIRCSTSMTSQLKIENQRQCMHDTPYLN